MLLMKDEVAMPSGVSDAKSGRVSLLLLSDYREVRILKWIMMTEEAFSWGQCHQDSITDGITRTRIRTKTRTRTRKRA